MGDLLMDGIVFDRVTKSYASRTQETPVFRGLSFTMEAGKMTALLGPSGSGKTTILNLIGAIDRPDSGSVTVIGQRVSDFSPHDASLWRRQQLGYVYQDAALIEPLTCAENIEVPMLLKGLSRTDRAKRVDALLSAVGLDGYGLRHPSELSRGQQQRVAMARALAATPRILLCDEPTGNLDRDNAISLMKLLAGLRDAFGLTIVLATHDPTAARFADKSMALEESRLCEVTP
ncbi:MAG: ABC transporter ATP-binding protein [Rhodothalassiaceae bacterium]